MFNPWPLHKVNTSKVPSREGHDIDFFEVFEGLSGWKKPKGHMSIVKYNFFIGIIIQFINSTLGYLVCIFIYLNLVLRLIYFNLNMSLLTNGICH